MIPRLLPSRISGRGVPPPGARFRAGLLGGVLAVAASLSARPDEFRPWDLGIVSGLVSPFSVRGWAAEEVTNGGPYALGQLVASPSIVSGWTVGGGGEIRYGLALGGSATGLPDVASMSLWTNVPLNEVTGLSSYLPGTNLVLRAADPGVVEEFRRCAQTVGIACGEFHTLMLRRDGTVAAAGWNSAGQADVPPSATNVVAIACGLDHSLALRADGTAVAWGRFVWRGQALGDPILPPPSENRDFVALAGGAANAVFLRRDGRVLVTGRRTNDVYLPPRSLTNAVAVAAGAYHCIALTSDRQTVEWGYELDGEGLPEELEHGPWPRVLPASDVTAVAAGGFFSMALHANGRVTVWGEEDEDYPVLDVPECATNVVAIAAGTYHALALRRDGTVVAWGAEEVVEVPADLNRVVAIAAGGYHNQVLVQNQDVLGWPRFEAGRFKAELNLPAGLRYRLESAGSDGRWIPSAPSVARPGQLSLDFPADGAAFRLFRVVPLGF